MTDPSIVRVLRLAALVCLLEAGALIALGILEIVSLHSGRLVIGITTTVFFAVYALALALAGRGLARGRSWTRAPLLLSQLIQLGLAWNFRGGGIGWVVSALLAVPALFVAVVLLLPATTRMLYGVPGSDDARSG